MLGDLSQKPKMFRLVGSGSTEIRLNRFFPSFAIFIAQLKTYELAFIQAVNGELLKTISYGDHCC